MKTLKHQTVIFKNLPFHYITAGKGPPLVLLHGFPETWYAWRHQIDALTKHFKVIVPDLPGFGDTGRLKEISDYTVKNVTSLFKEWIESLGFQKVHLVGHDWGGAICWRMAQEFPHFIDRLAVLNSPHPLLFKKALKNSTRQKLKSSYMILFQFPRFVEFILNFSQKKSLKICFKEVQLTNKPFQTKILKFIKRPS